MIAQAQSVGVPSVKGMTDAFGDFAIGGIGGILYSVSRAVLGTGFLGAVISPVLAGSVVKGARGTALATVAGFMACQGLFAGGLNLTSAAESLPDNIM